MIASHSRRDSGVTSVSSARVIDCRAKGGGRTGIGCVGCVFSPGIRLSGNGRSSTGKSGSPVSRCRTKTKPDFVTCATAGTSLPFRFTVTRTGAAGRS